MTKDDQQTQLHIRIVTSVLTGKLSGKRPVTGLNPDMNNRYAFGGGDPISNVAIGGQAWWELVP